MNQRITLIKRDIEIAKDKLRDLGKQLVEATKDRLLKCSNCAKRSRLNTCNGIDVRYYDPNTGSPCGGFYAHGQYAWECPKCANYRNNSLTDEDYYEMFQSFKNCIERNQK